jgi:hypothetical protein
MNRRPLIVLLLFVNLNMLIEKNFYRRIRAIRTNPAIRDQYLRIRVIRTNPAIRDQYLRIRVIRTNPAIRD